MSTTPDRRALPMRVLAALVAAALLASCANMPLNKPSALSPAHHSATEAP